MRIVIWVMQRGYSQIRYQGRGNVKCNESVKEKKRKRTPESIREEEKKTRRKGTTKK